VSLTKLLTHDFRDTVANKIRDWQY